jgi:hypothetical protein
MMKYSPATIAELLRMGPGPGGLIMAVDRPKDDLKTPLERLTILIAALKRAAKVVAASGRAGDPVVQGMLSRLCAFRQMSWPGSSLAECDNRVGQLN